MTFLFCDHSSSWPSNLSVDYIDVGDGCWRPNVLVTSLRYWWPIQDVGDQFNALGKSPKTKKVANIMILPPTSEISRHHNITKITMSPTSLSPYQSSWFVINDHSVFLSFSFVTVPFRAHPFFLTVYYCERPILRRRSFVTICSLLIFLPYLTLQFYARLSILNSAM